MIYTTQVNTAALLLLTQLCFPLPLPLSLCPVTIPVLTEMSLLACKHEIPMTDIYRKEYIHMHLYTLILLTGKDHFDNIHYLKNLERPKPHERES